MGTNLKQNCFINYLSRMILFRFILFFLSLFSFTNLLATSIDDGKSGNSSDLIYLQGIYERGVNYGEQGDIIKSFTTLDSLRTAKLTAESGRIKSRGMLYLALASSKQGNHKYATVYADLALFFGKDSLSTDEIILIYDLMITSYDKLQNKSKVSQYVNLKKVIEDSLNAAKIQFEVDSLKQLVEEQKTKFIIDSIQKSKQQQLSQKNQDTTNKNNFILYISIFIISLISILVLVFSFKRKNKNVQKDIVTPNEILKLQNNSVKQSNSIVEKLARVELVFIRAEVLGEYGNKKAVVKIINDYNTQLPLIIKNLDDAITTNDNEPIINALSYLKPYLTAFGMAATLAMLTEVEVEAPTEKTTKLLSRVFQIRNHIRRAHDETKALIDMLG
jgi:hypothetical protein